jgi:hypothetical protein
LKLWLAQTEFGNAEPWSYMPQQPLPLLPSVARVSQPTRLETARASCAMGMNVDASETIVTGSSEAISPARKLSCRLIQQVRQRGVAARHQTLA